MDWISSLWNSFVLSPTANSETAKTNADYSPRGQPQSQQNGMSPSPGGHAKEHHSGHRHCPQLPPLPRNPTQLSTDRPETPDEDPQIIN